MGQNHKAANPGTGRQLETTLNGHSVKLIFSSRENEEAIQTVKDILMKALFRRSAPS